MSSLTSRQRAIAAANNAEKKRLADLLVVELSEIIQTSLPDHSWRVREPSIVLVDKTGQFTDASQLTTEQNTLIVDTLREAGILNEGDGRVQPGTAKASMRTSAGTANKASHDIRFQLRLPSDIEKRQKDLDWLKKHKAELKAALDDKLKAKKAATVLMFEADPDAASTSTAPVPPKAKSGRHDIEAFNIAESHLTGNDKYEVLFDDKSYQVRLKEGAISAFTVTADKITVHAPDNDEVMKDAIRIAIKMFDGKFKSSGAHPDFDVKTVRLIQEMLADGIPLVNAAGLPVDKIQFNGALIPLPVGPIAPVALRRGGLAPTPPPP